MSKYLMNSIYSATEGEGIHIGTPQVFVRFQGCSIGCLNCDSKDTWEFTGQELTKDQVLSAIEDAGGKRFKRVSITGGDPLHPTHVPNVLELVKELKSRDYYVNIEAAGTRIVTEIFDELDFISFDYKTPSTGVKTRASHISKLNELYSGKFQVKAVIESSEDFQATLDAYNIVLSTNESLNFVWCLTPSYNLNEEFPLERFRNVIKWNEENGALFRVIGQQHKWLFGPDEKQV
ncbi:7-carboxy-7-deazaguanine synthase QueE [Halobacteriovorax sp. HLS]|uniref:7-carboxy-7-deazaguanine synthase QueE n=1 Tax=Halobacteriovorax sp. HLS TaxID=2234000 RepID=UPI000FD86526|nr:7-carboxy-7-deazaguanine synthase QueE [Halobacteriovorax sp. HLS]